MEEYESSDGVATREFKRLRNEIESNLVKISKQDKEIERLRFLVTQGRHELFKKKLITFEEVRSWQV